MVTFVCSQGIPPLVLDVTSNTVFLLSAMSQEVQGTLLSLNIYACVPAIVFKSGPWELLRSTSLLLHLSAVRSSWGL